MKKFTHLIQNRKTLVLKQACLVGDTYFDLQDINKENPYGNAFMSGSVWKLISKLPTPDSEERTVLPQRTKYFQMYMDMAVEVSKQSYAKRKQVGAIIVTPEGLTALGWNGMPTGYANTCEWVCEDGKGYETGETRPEVIHAEENALNKMTKAGLSSTGSILFTTLSPCMSCAKRIYGAGIKAVYYKTNHSDEALTFLMNMGVYHQKLED